MAASLPGLLDEARLERFGRRRFTPESIYRMVLAMTGDAEEADREQAARAQDELDEYSKKA